MKRRPRILLSAGEASGDRLGAGLARALLARRPDLELVGMGGAQMRAAGVRIVQDAADVAVVGITEVLKHLPAIRAAMRELEARIAEGVDLVVPIDFPDFNLRLAARAHAAGRRVVYFVSPQVWAWRRGRVRQIRRVVRRMLVLFPFECAIYEAAGVPVSFVGHPVAEQAREFRDRDALCQLARLDPSRGIVALVPGSRRSEVGRLLRPMLQAAELMAARHPRMQWLLTRAPSLDADWFAASVSEASSGLRPRIHCGDFPEILSICDAGVVASGTACLEAAVVGMPLVVVYRMAPLSHLIGRALVRLPFVALPNLVAGEEVAPELIQGACRPERIAEELLRFVEQPRLAAESRARLAAVREQLGGEGIFERAAEALLEEL